MKMFLGSAFIGLLMFTMLIIGVKYGTEQGYSHGYEIGYMQGSESALTIRPANERLEYVCAALWFNKEVKR